MKALHIADAICKRIAPHADRVNIAGSIRRKKPDVGDIEIICLPTYQAIDYEDLFGETETSFTIHPQFKSTVLGLGKVIKGKPIGRMMQIELSSGIMLDLFMPQPHDYFRQYAVRTGSANYSQLMIATGWKRQGWVGTEDGLRRKDECKEIQLPTQTGTYKSKWVCIVDDPTLPPVWQSEEQFFAWLEIPFLNPINRNM